MIRYIMRRLLISIPVLFGVTVITFTAYQLAPGDPVTALIQPGVDPEYVKARQAELGLNQPIFVQYLAWLRELSRGNLGYSYRNGMPVARRIAQAIPATLQLNATATLLAVAAGIPLGILSALRQHSFLDSLLTLISFVGVSAPVFFLSIGAIYLFALRIDIFPAFGMRDPQAPIQWLDRLYHLALPALVSGLWSIAGFLRYTRSSILEVLGADYVRTARAKGLSERAVMMGHAFRSGLIPVVTYIGLTVPWLFSGSVIVETIFSWPGMGQLAISALGARDYPLIMGIALVMSVIVLITNLLVDISYAWLDPRVRFE